jgi:alcohol dehydrogenase
MPHATRDQTDSALRPIEFPSRTRLVFGPGSLRQIGTLASELGAKHILLVTDAGIVTAGHAGRAKESLVTAGLQVTLFDKARENPTTKCVDDCVTVASAAGVDTIIGLGGGSSMDTAKGCNFILTNGGRMQDYWGVGKATKPMLPFIAIPTTAGTGSELQSAALIADEVTHQKMACLDPKCAAAIAILDPELTLSQPPRVTACTGIDAIAHAVETAVTTKRNQLSQRLSTEAFQLCMGALTEVLTEPNRLEARARMQLGAAYAGAAIENSMLGAAHAAANPLTAHCGIVHGHAVGLMLPHVVRFNAADVAAGTTYSELARGAGIASNGSAVVEKLCERLRNLLSQAGLPTALEACRVERKDIAMLAEDAARQWTAGFNPRPITSADFAALYTQAWS